MLVLVTYDVNTETAAGRKRLRKVAKACVNHGQRVQNSVFECVLDAAQYTVFKAQLTALIDPAADSLRFYQLGNHYKNRVEHVGLHPEFAQDEVLLLEPRCEPPAPNTCRDASHQEFQHFMVKLLNVEVSVLPLYSGSHRPAGK